MKLTKQRQQELLYLAKLVTEEHKTEIINFSKEKEIADLMNTLVSGSYYELRFFIKLRYLLDNTFKLTKQDRLDLFNNYYSDNTLYPNKPHYTEEPKQNWFDSISIPQWISLLIITLIIVLAHID